MDFDVVIVGGGPAGISAGLELSQAPGLKIGLFESESDLGGIPRSCHIFFGMRDLKKIYRGPAYANQLNRSIRKTPVSIHTRATVQDIVAGNQKNPHQIEVSSSQGMITYQSRFVLITTGCFESSRQTRFIPGTRPAGIFTTGTLQQLVNLRNQKPGTRALIIGSEHVALSSILSLKKAGMSIVGMVEKDPLLQTYTVPLKAMSVYFGFPIFKGFSLKSIQGSERVEGAELINEENKKVLQVECDTIILTGKFRPDSQLIDHTPIIRDPQTQGPLIDMDLMTSIPNIFAAGNILRGAARHDICALEGKKAAQSILSRINPAEPQPDEELFFRADPPIRFVVPQKIIPRKISSPALPWFYSGYFIQTENTIIKPTLEAWSGNEKIWERSYRRMIARTSYTIPVAKFGWENVNTNKGVILKLRSKRY